MKKVVMLGTGVLLATGLVGCSDPFASATVSIEVTGAPEIIGEQVSISVDVSGVSLEKVLVVQEQVDGGDWVDIQSFSLADSETSASVTDVVDEADTVLYRVLLLPSEGTESRAEALSQPFAPVSLEEFVDAKLGLELIVKSKPDESDYFFDGDLIGIEATVDFNVTGLKTSYELSYKSSGTIVLAEDLSVGSNSVNWEVGAANEVETGELVLTASVTGQAGTVQRSAQLPVTIADPVQSFEALSSAANEASSSDARRALLLAAAGDLFVDESSKAWVDGLSVNFVFDEPFLGAINKFEPAMRYGVPQSCAPNGEVETTRLSGRPFLIESELAGYDFDETIFGYFDGRRVLFSAAWKFCLG